MAFLLSLEASGELRPGKALWICDDLRIIEAETFTATALWELTWIECLEAMHLTIRRSRFLDILTFRFIVICMHSILQLSDRESAFRDFDPARWISKRCSECIHIWHYRISEGLRMSEQEWESVCRRPRQIRWISMLWVALSLFLNLDVLWMPFLWGCWGAVTERIDSMLKEAPFSCQ